MAITNHERVGKAMELLRAGLAPFVEQELEDKFPEKAELQASYLLGEGTHLAGRSILDYDVAALLKLMWKGWNQIFGQTLGQNGRSLVSELRDARNRWAHQDTFSGDDAYRALDSAGRLLTAVIAPEAAEVEKMKTDLLRVRFDEQVRAEKRKSAAPAVESSPVSGLPSWRDVITPHRDVASGHYQQAEFAADLWQVHIGQGSDEYRHPVEFFRRTYLTESLKRLLVGAVQRLNGGGGDPVVQLQTNFGGGKTHSMLALYHLFSGTEVSALPGIDAVLAEARVGSVPAARRVVLVGNKISPGNPSKKPDGTVVRTLWGELAWQLGGREAYARLAADDEHATSPGDLLRELFVTYGPCLVLIDEWVAYARQLHDQSNLPGGSFETQFTFAQALTESAKLAGNCLLVVSLPASDTGGSPHTHTDDVEVGGVRGREALDRLRNVVGRVEASWRPASAEEGFEIVRRRLFEPLVDQTHFKQRDVVARAFCDLYRTQRQEFPPECSEAEYETRMKGAYPIHPEVFDRLYGDWSTLVKFQRTRGVLRLMAAVIHSLWEKGDRTPLILPSTIPIEDSQIQFELTRYLSDNWMPVIERDVDGPNSLPVRIDREVSNLGKLSATRRVARTIYLGSAPSAGAAHHGLDDRRIKLGCMMPGESPSVFGDALRRLVAGATYLYPDGPRYWYSTQPTVTKLAEDRAEQLKRDPDKVEQELYRRLRSDLRQTGDFERIYPMPRTGAEVPDELSTRLVVLGIEHLYTKEANAAEAAARAILENRGNSPRLFRNTLVFLAADKTKMQDLDEAVRRYLAWESVLAERDSLELLPSQAKQAETQKAAAESTITARLPEAYSWLLVPEQTSSSQSAVQWQALRLSGQEPLAVRAGKKLRGEELLIRSFAATRLRLELDRVPLWRGDHVPVRQLVEDFASYIYLPRLSDPAVLGRAVLDGIPQVDWERNTFAYADSFDEVVGRYRGLRVAQHITMSADDPTGLIVRPEAARRQLDVEAAEDAARAAANRSSSTEPDGEGNVRDKSAEHPEYGSNGQPTTGDAQPSTVARKPVRYFASVPLDASRVGRDAARIAEEVIAHLVGMVGARVTVTLEIEAHIPDGAPEQVVRTVTENGRALKFTNHGFSNE